MLEDAYNEILSLIKSNEKVNFIDIDKNGMVTVSDIESLNPKMFLSTTEALEYIEKL